MKPATYLVTVMDSHGVTHVFRLAVGQDFTLVDAAKAGKILSVEPVTPGKPCEANEINAMLKDSTWSAQDSAAWLTFKATDPPAKFTHKMANYWKWNLPMDFPIHGKSVVGMLGLAGLESGDYAVQFRQASIPCGISREEREARELLVWVEVLAGRERAEGVEADVRDRVAEGAWPLPGLRELVSDLMAATI